MKRARLRGAKQLDAEIMVAVQNLMRDNGAEFLRVMFYGTSEFDSPKGNWIHLYRFLAVLAQRFGFTEYYAHALYDLGFHLSDWNQRVEAYKASVEAWRSLPPAKRDCMYNYALLFLARTYCEQDVEHQLKEALEIATELIVLETNKQELDTNDAQEVQQKAAEKLAALRKKVNA